MPTEAFVLAVASLFVGAVAATMIKHFILDPRAHEKEAHRLFVALCSFFRPSKLPLSPSKADICDAGMLRAADLYSHLAAKNEELARYEVGGVQTHPRLVLHGSTTTTLPPGPRLSDTFAIRKGSGEFRRAGRCMTGWGMSGGANLAIRCGRFSPLFLVR